MKTKKAKDKAKSKRTSAIKRAKPAARAKKLTRLPPQLRLFEKRRHPRFLLSGEQFREIRTGKVYPVYDLSMSGLSVQVDEKPWPLGTVVKGILNLHPDSIECGVRVISYYGNRAAMQFEMPSTYARSVLTRALNPKRLGLSLRLIREKLPFADFWYHGVCNTDLLLKLTEGGRLFKAEVFFSNFYWSWSAMAPTGQTASSRIAGNTATGVCQSIGREKREDMLLAEEPVLIESIQLAKDSRLDNAKVEWARAIVESAPIDQQLKDFLLKQFSVE